MLCAAPRHPRRSATVTAAIANESQTLIYNVGMPEAAQQPYALWHEIALPLLRYIGEDESASWNKVQFAEELAAEAGLGDRVNEVDHEMRRLIDEGYITCRSEPVRLQFGTRYFGQGLSGKGARAIEQWPPSDLVVALKSYIDLQISRVDTDEERQIWKRFKQAVEDIPSHMIGMVINLAVSAAAAPPY